MFVSIAVSTAFSQVKPGTDSSSFYQAVNTYVNPVLPGDHPDPTLLKVGDDFYHCGSSFHFNPYLPIYHSKDLIHWQVISRVLPAAKAGFVTDRPSAGVWQGAITYFYGSYWIYFSANGQWFSKASTPAGPWSEPVQVKTNPVTGNLGYDNSIFVDDDGKPYMVIKNGQKVNRVQELGKDGQLTGEVINLDWVNAKLQYSWAEGPVMCKRNGFYYYFPAGDVTGGQYVLRGKALTGDSTKWERLGNFFKPVTDVKTGFRRPNHISAPFQLSNGTWWTIGQSYEKYDGNDWSGMGRQTALYPVTWEGDRPWGAAPTTQPIIKPDLPRNSIPWRSVKTDYFNGTALDLNWHFLNKKAGSRYSLNEHSGWLRLRPDTARTHLVQKETDHYYSAVTRVDCDASAAGEQAGLYLTSGSQKVSARLFTGYEQGKKIVFELDTARRSIPNTFGQIVWLKLERSQHMLRAYCSKDGKKWVSLGAPVNARGLDKTQPNYNSWVGTSIGLFAEGKVADFDCFICKDGTATMPAAGYSNYYGVKTLDGLGVTNTSDHGGWFMLSGVELGNVPTTQVYIKADAKVSGQMEIWLDDLGQGKLVATIPVKAGAGWKSYQSSLKGLTGQHDVFVKFPAGSKESVTVDSIRFSN
ncbi:MAG: family 43 glycosylhydrolase [Bacteroidota bacterium]